jgi:hypothetical protein
MISPGSHTQTPCMSGGLQHELGRHQANEIGKRTHAKAELLGHGDLMCITLVTRRALQYNGVRGRVTDRHWLKSRRSLPCCFHAFSFCFQRELVMYVIAYVSPF